ncbi:MAG: cation:proton antiporter [Candidatus Aminicenantes bacterium]|nr:cation:proton antiporter [Candidatus Aminicenantes bacterium]
MIPVIFVFLSMWLLKSSALFPFANPQKSTSIALGFILIFAFLFGKQINRFKLPQITGFIFAGIICGPYLMKFLSSTDVKGLQLLDGLALSLIALTAGGEMQINRLRGRMKSISSIVLFQTLVIVGGFILFGLVARSIFPIFSKMTDPVVFAFFLLLGILATATSPSTTIAIINETRSQGKHTDLILSVAVVKDFFIIILLAFSLSISLSITSLSRNFDMNFLLEILKEVGLSIGIGLVVGGSIILYLKYIKKELTVFILSIAFFTYQISQSYDFHPLLICLTAGFLVENFSAQGEKFILAIEKSSLPVYVIFFAISGASLDLSALKAGWLLALLCVLLRGGFKFIGTYFGAKLARDDIRVQKKSWAGYISQAGVALGMAIVIEENFPGWGGEFKTLVLAIIALNQIIGPVILQRFLIHSGEVGKKGSVHDRSGRNA